jgi:hypothetical protein
MALPGPYFVDPQPETSFAPSRAVAGALWRSATRALWRVGDQYPRLDVGLFYNQELSERAFSWGIPFLAASLNF